MSLPSWILPIGIALVLAGVVALFFLLYRRPKPDLGLTHYVRGLNHLIAGEEEAAYRELVLAARSGLEDLDLYLRLGDLLRERGKPGQALQMHLGLTVKPDLGKVERTRVLRSLAEDYASMGRSNSCVETLEELVRLESEDPEVRQRLAGEYFKQGEISKAFRTLKQMGRRTGHPGDRELASFLAAAAEKVLGDPASAGENQVKEARRLLGRALRLDPSCPPALRLQGELAEREGDLNAVIRSWVRLVVEEPELGTRIYRRLEKLLFDRGRFGELGRIYREVLASNPGDEEATLGLAHFQEKRGAPEGAVEVLEAYRSRNGDPRRIAPALALLHLKQDNVRAAEELLRRLVETRDETIRYVCGECGSVSGEKRWYCPSCSRFNTYARE
jgi:lipopolysaccharide biosynthesis regulator YciM